MKSSIAFVLILLFSQSTQVFALNKFSSLRGLYTSTMRRIAPRSRPFPFVRYNWRGCSGKSFPSATQTNKLNAEQTALMVIDMQKFFVAREGTHEAEENRLILRKLHKSQKQTISLAASLDMPVVFVEYDKHKRTQKKLLHHAKQESEAISVHRKTSDAIFSDRNQNKADLIADLASKNIENLLMIGANGGSCVKASINSALEEGYKVIVYPQAIADFNSKNFKHPCDYKTNIFFREVLADHFFQMQEIKDLRALFEGL